jgi:hypothetical protein
MSTNDQLLELFYGAFPKGPDALGQALAQFRSELTADLAKMALDRYSAAVNRQDADGAIASATIASRIFNFIGRREDAFNALVDYFYVLYMLAQTEKAYADIHTALTSILAQKPYDNGAPETGLRALVLCADCGFFACEAAAADASKQHWLQAALQSLQEGSQYLTLSGAPVLIQGYASTTVAVYRRCLSAGWIGEPWAAPGLAAVTAALDRAVPAKVVYPGNDSKTANIDEGRAEMSAAFDHGVYRGEPSPAPNVSGLFGRKSV